MRSVTNAIYLGANGRESLYDKFVPEREESRDVFIFVHGYKGYKDWGAWDLMLETIAKEGHISYSFNFSHNGGTVDNSIDFPDLMAFSENRYTYELSDLNTMIDLVVGEYPNKKIHLLAHSRGGGIALLAGANNPKITSIYTLASVSDFGSRFPQGEALEIWKKNGVYSALNARTKQEMPHKYSFYIDFKENEDSLTIQRIVEKSNKPMFHIHGTKDEAVSLESSKRLAEWSNGKLLLLDGANHTFGTKQPWDSDQLSSELQHVVTIINENCH